MSRRELAIALILFMGLLAPLIEIPIANAIIPQDQTISIDSTHNDKWTTGTGSIGIDSWLVHVLDPGYDVYSWVIFREVEINFWEPLHNATLRLYTGNTLEFDKASSITIYGMKVDELQNILPIGSSYAVSAPKTDHYVNLNTSQFYGPSKWWDIDVTAIVEELIRAHNWDGDGLTGGDTGDAIGFIMYGASGHDVRYFVDYRSDPALSAQLVIHWNHQPPLIDGPPGAEFVEQYRNYTIWYVPGNLTDILYIFSQYDGADNDVLIDDISGTGPYLVNSTGTIAGTALGGQRKLLKTSDGTLFATYAGRAVVLTQIWIKESTDDGQTWTNEVKLSSLAGMEAVQLFGSCIAVDSLDNLHVVFYGLTPFNDVYYTNYTDSWSTPLLISVFPPCVNDQDDPVIAIDSNDVLHVAWGGGAFPEIYYTNYTGSWSTPFVISTDPGMDTGDNENPSIAIDSDDHIHVSWWGQSDAYPTNRQIWHIEKTTTWQSISRVSIKAGMENRIQVMPCIVIDPDDYPHVTWHGKDSSTAQDQAWENYYNGTAWQTPIRLSTDAVSGDRINQHTNIVIDENSTRFVMWYDNIGDLWLTIYTDAWSTPTIIQSSGVSDQNPNMIFPLEPPENGTYFIADLNGTIVENDCDNIECSKNKIDIIMDPDPKDPDPPGWVTEGPFTRFKMRLYLLVIGYGCVWGPIWFFCWRRPSGFYICGGALVMLMGLGLLIQIVYV